MSGTKKRKGLLDSNIIIYASKGEVNLEPLTVSYSSLHLSIISYVEVAGYAFEDEEEEAVVMAILSEIPTVNLDMSIARRAISYRKQKKIKLPDALILATAREIGADLLTFNVKDFKDLDDDVAVITPPKV